MRHAIITSSAILLMVGALSGCTTPRRPVNAWRECVASFIVSEGHGDPAVLRSLPVRTSPDVLRPALITIGCNDVLARENGQARYVDVRGALVGCARWRNELWYVFLVATAPVPPEVGGRHLDTTAVIDLRTVAFTTRGGAFAWRVGEADEAARQRYVAAQRSSRSAVAALRDSFPAPGDDLQLRRTDDEWIIVERNSGAHWSIKLDDNDKPRADTATRSPSPG